MLKSLSIAFVIIGVSLANPFVRANEAFFDQSEEVEIIHGSPMERNVEVKEKGDAILEFKAWYRAKEPAGFYATLNVSWNGKRLTEILDRPTSVYVEGSEREFATRSENGWLTAILPDAGSAEMPSRYYIAREVLDIVTFRFKLPVEQAGIYPLAISSSLRDPKNEYYDTLIVSDLRVYHSNE